MSHDPAYGQGEWEMGTHVLGRSTCAGSQSGGPDLQNLLGLWPSPTIPKGCSLATAPEPEVWEWGSGSTRSSLGRLLVDVLPPQPSVFPHSARTGVFTQG